jgi:hypothetical protein
LKRSGNSWILVLILSVIVSGCNGLNAAPMTQADAQVSNQTDTAHGPSLANKQILVVSGNPLGLMTFPADSNGAPAPLRFISGPDTKIVVPWGGAILDDGSLWVVDQLKSERPGYALKFSSTANGNVHPSEFLRCLENVDAGTIGLDAQGSIYIAGVNDNVYVYAPGAQGCVSAVRDITGPHTLLNGPFISVDQAGEVYSANYFSNSVTSYAPGSTGDVTPLQDITGRKTHLVNPSAVGVDANGDIFVLDNDQPNSFGFNVLVFAPGATGDVAPIREIKGPTTLLLHSRSIAVSSDGWVFVANPRFHGYGLITAFAPGANGDVAPTHIIKGSAKSFIFPISVTIQP